LGPIIDAGWIEPFDFWNPIEAPVGGNDLAGAHPPHYRGVNKVSSIQLGIEIRKIGRVIEIGSENGLHAFPHESGKLSEEESTFTPTPSRPEVVDDFLEYLCVGEELVRTVDD
jgi:hypothetical protein